MMECENPVEVELKEPLNNDGKLEQAYPGLGQETCTCSRVTESDADKQNLENGLRQRVSCDWQRSTHCCIDGDKATLLKKCNHTSIIAIVLALLLTVSVCFNIIQYAKIKQLQTTSASVTTANANYLHPNYSLHCPPIWITTGEKCYFFSGTQRSWDDSQSNCSSYGGSLVTIYSQQEWAFLKQHRRPAEYWVNLRRDKADDPWKWPNGSLVDSWFPIGGKGYCAYLNEKAASSTFCDNDRYWICSKPVSSI